MHASLAGDCHQSLVVGEKAFLAFQLAMLMIMQCCAPFLPTANNRGHELGQCGSQSQQLSSNCHEKPGADLQQC